MCVSYEEKGTCVYLVTSAGAYAVYLAIIANVIYLGFVLWAVAGSVPSSTTPGRISPAPDAATT